MKKALSVALALCIIICTPIESKAAKYTEIGEYGRPFILVPDSKEQISEEQILGDMELIAQLVQAEAGNQSLEGKRLVVDVILNRVDDPRFPNSVEEVIFQKYKGRYQFSVVANGEWEKAAYNMKDDDYEAVSLEYESRTNLEVLYFCAKNYISKTTPVIKEGGHYFSK